MGKIVAGSWSYTLTDEDKLWAARMAQYEGGNPAATLWTMTQAYARRAIHSRYPTFTDFIRSYSQPINPIWALGGSRCPNASDDPSSPCYTNRLRARERASTMAFSQADGDVQEAVNKWYAGTLPNPVPKAVEFADNTVGQHYIDAHPGSYLVLRSGNLYIATAESAGWHADYVRMAATVGAGILGFVVLAAVGAGGYWLYKRRKRRKLGFGGIQEDAQRAWEEFDEEISESLYAWGDRGHAPGLYDKAEPILDRSGNRVGWKIDELLDCGDLNHRIKKLTKAEDRFMAFAFSHEPDEYDSVTVQLDQETIVPFDPDLLENMQWSAHEEREKLRSLARANGCTQIGGLRGRRLR
jgi:hypothetical protein